MRRRGTDGRVSTVHMLAGSTGGGDSDKIRAKSENTQTDAISLRVPLPTQ